MTDEQIIQPPLGVMPQRIWDEKRAYELTEAIRRYTFAGLTPANEWQTELEEICARHNWDSRPNVCDGRYNPWFSLYPSDEPYDSLLRKVGKNMEGK